MFSRTLLLALSLSATFLCRCSVPDQAFAAPWTGVFFSPESNLEMVDLDVLRQATKTLDIAMYAFTDKKVAAELVALANRGVHIRIYRDRTQIKDRGDVTALLRGVPNIEILVKDNLFWNIMHLKGYCVDNTVVRLGSANWSPTGEGSNCYHGSCGHAEQQDNEILVTSDPAVVSSFERTFSRIWARSTNRSPS